MLKRKNFLFIGTLLISSFTVTGCVPESSIQAKGLSLSNTMMKSTNKFKKKALLVGISDYAGENSDLNGIERDIEKMKKLFESWGFETKVLYDKDSMNMISYLDGYSTSLGTNDYFAFYYSGHGSHTPDKNHDESDGEDESLVLSDGQENMHLIDDVLYAKFNSIQAKKMIFFDSCHSGTVFRSLSGKSQSKTISPLKVTKTFTKGLSATSKSDTLSANSNYIVFSSSQDNEESLATPIGSLFTNSIYEMFSNQKAYNQSFSTIKKNLTNEIIAYAKKAEGKPHHPNISFSKSYSNSSSMKDFLEVKSTASETSPTVVKLSSSTINSNSENSMLQHTLDNLISSGEMETMTLSNTRNSYKSGESIKFSLDTKGEEGYLTLFYIDSNDVTLLYPNPYVRSKKIQGKYRFPDDFSNGKFELEAYKSCANCQEEKTVIYTLLSSKPILDASAISSKDGLKSFKKNSSESKNITRAVRIKAKKILNQAFKPQLNKYNFMVK